jgi:hypothetical protein
MLIYLLMDACKARLTGMIRHEPIWVDPVNSAGFEHVQIVSVKYGQLGSKLAAMGNNPALSYHIWLAWV